MNNNNNLIVRYNTTITRPYNVQKVGNVNQSDSNTSLMYQSSMINSNGHVKYRKVYTKHNVNNLQVAAKRKNNDTINSYNCNPEV